MTNSNQTISLSEGAIEYSYPLTITETTGKNLTADTVQVSLGTYDGPGTWVTPSVLTRPTTSSITVQLLIGGSFTPNPGQYWMFVRVTDAPEIVPRRGGRITIT